MRIGLLVCDHVADNLQHIDGDYPEMFENLFADHPDIEIVSYDTVAGEIPVDSHECDGWLTTGSRHSVNQEETWIADLESFVREVAATDVGFVGICFGHQLLAKALGGTVATSEAGWGVGIGKVEMTSGASFRIANSHSEQIEAVPAGATVLGSSEHCPIAVMRVGESVLGIQGHPEMSSRYLEALLAQRRGRLIPETVADAGISSLSRGADREFVATMIVEFFRESVRT